MATNTTVVEASSPSPRPRQLPDLWREAFGRLFGTIAWPSSAWSSSCCSCSRASSGRSSRRGRTRSRICQAVFANGNRPLPPLSPNHLLGTDQLGRDLLSRLLDGARISVTVAFVVQIVILLIGVPIGALAGWFGGRLDNVLMRFTDVIYAFPDLLFIILLSVAFRETCFGQALDGLLLVFVAIGLRRLGHRRPPDPRPAAGAQGDGVRRGGQGDRCVRSARSSTRHLLPNGMGPIIVAITLGIPAAILAEATLAYIGIGVQPPRASWGSLIAEGQKFVRSEPHLVLFPAICIALALIGFTFLGDGLRDALDPKLKGKQ